MDLVANGDSFKIKRLDYFKSFNPETVMKNQKLITPQPTIGDYSDEDFQNQLKAFLIEYSRTYSEMDLDKFANFFASGAIEKGKPFTSQLKTYRDNFKQIDSIDYKIGLKHHSIQQDTGLIRIDGTFYAGMRLKNSNELKKISGDISMDVIATGDSFKIWRLDYFTRDVQKIALKTKNDKTRLSSDNPKAHSPSPIQKNNHIAADGATKGMDQNRETIAVKKQPDNNEKYTIQVAASKDIKAADEMLALLKGKGYPAYLTKVQLSGNTWYRIQTGDFRSKNETIETLNRLKKDQFNGIIIKKPNDISSDQKTSIDTQEEKKLTTSITDDFRHVFLQNRLETFLFDYCQTYASKQLDKFTTFFTSDAIEKSKSFQSQIPKYRQYFDTIDSLSYWVDLKHYSIPQNTNIIQIEGTFNIQVQLNKGSKKWESSSGDISMDLVANGDTFKIRRLDYYVR